jgi:hypothetical protein
MGLIGTDLSHGLTELVDLVAEAISRFRIDDGDGGGKDQASGVPDLSCGARRHKAPLSTALDRFPHQTMKVAFVRICQSAPRSGLMTL